MRIPAVASRGGLVLLLLVMIIFMSVMFWMDQSGTQVRQLNNQISELKARYYFKMKKRIDC